MLGIDYDFVKQLETIVALTRYVFGVAYIILAVSCNTWDDSWGV